MDEPDADPPIDYPPPPAGARRGRAWTTAGFVLAVVAVFLFPPGFGAAAVACGVVGLRKGDPLGKRAAIAGVAGMVIGITLSAILYASR